MSVNFFDISYLKEGNLQQQQAYEVLTLYKVLEALEDFTPVLVGTVPIAIALAKSDLDVICCFKDQRLFIETIIEKFSMHAAFQLRLLEQEGETTVVANFFIKGVEIELFAQSVPVVQQNGYLHMLIEAALLELNGEEFRQMVLRLKQNGLKTEPAFAQLLGLNGNPYEALLAYGEENGFC